MRKALLLAFAVASVFTSVIGAQVRMDLRINVAPPPARVEVIPPAPSPEHYWIAGHWQYEGNQHVWVAGHWEAPRAGEFWVRPFWLREGDAWVFHPGRWIKVAPPAEFVRVAVNTRPPLPRAERVPPQPSIEDFWVPGFWRWESGGFVWVEGRWERHRPDAVWIQAHWMRAGNVW